MHSIMLSTLATFLLCLQLTRLTARESPMSAANLHTPRMISLGVSRLQSRYRNCWDSSRRLCIGSVSSSRSHSAHLAWHPRTRKAHHIVDAFDGLFCSTIRFTRDGRAEQPAKGEASRGGRVEHIHKGRVHDCRPAQHGHRLATG